MGEKQAREGRPPGRDRQPRSVPEPRHAKPVPPQLHRLQQPDVLDLQRTVGNQATTTALQRHLLSAQRDSAQGDGRGPVAWDVPAIRKNRPTHGADVRSALRAELPGLLAGLTDAQLTHWQQLVDYYAVDRHLRREITALNADWEYRAGPLYGASPDYQAARRRLDQARPRKPEGDTTITVDPRSLLADDVRAEPEWDVAAEKAFRQWAVTELVKDPPTFDTYPVQDDEIISRRTWVGSYTTQGLITLSDLRRRFADQYRSMVTDRDDWRRLRQALAETDQAFREAVDTHKERSAINKKNAGWLGVDIVRNLIEAVGEGDQDYPAMAQWEEPKSLIARSRSLMEQRQFEVLVPVLAMAELATAQAANRVWAYENRIESGARFWVRWLNRVKTVGSVAASVAAGPLGVTGSALVAGGYTLVQEGGQNAMAYALGQRSDLGLTTAIKQAGVATAAGILGGALQTRFQSAMATRMATITGASGGAVRQTAVSAAAAMTSSTYTTAAEAVLNTIVLGHAVPKSATEFADLIVDNALQAGAMDVALRGPSARVAREYQAWKAGRSVPVLPPPGGEPPASSTADRATRPDPSAAVRDMPDDVVRRLLTQSGGWQRLRSELQTGSGLGHGLVPAERRALIDRFDATREQQARDVAAMFEGTVVAADTGAGLEIEIRFSGERGLQHSTEATAYLDTKSPGWRRELGVAVSAGAQDTGARGTRVARALDQITPEGRRMAERFAPLYETWHTRGPLDKVRALVQVINDYNRPFGVPDIYPLVGRSENAGQFNWTYWQLEIHPMSVAKRRQTPEEFARLVDTVVHEGRHALDAFRAVRANPQRARGRVAREVLEAALASDLGVRPAESLAPGSLGHDEGLRFSESVWGSGRQHRKQTYEALDAAQDALRRAIREVRRNRGQPRGSDARQEAARFYWAAKTARERAHDAYMRLPEEVEPWRAGREAQAAVRERLALETEIRTVRAQVELTYQRLVRTEDAYVDAALNATAGLAGSERAFERAKRLYELTVAQLTRLRERHAALSAPAPAQP